MKKTKQTRPLISRNIQERRKAFGLNQDDLASKAGIGISTLKDIERGVSSPERHTVEALAQVLGCSIESLYGQGAKKEIQLSFDDATSLLFAFGRATLGTQKTVREILGIEVFQAPQLETLADQPHKPSAPRSSGK